MKYITSISRPGKDGNGLPDFFPSLEEFKQSTGVKLCEYRPAAGMQFTYYNYKVIVIAIYGEYEQIHLDEITALSKIRPGQHIVVPTPLDPPPHYVMPSNVHWLTFKSMYAIYAKNATWIDQARPAIKKHFISLNHRHMWFRQELFYYLYQNNLLDTAYFSYACDDRFDEGKENLFRQGNEVIGVDRYPTLDKQALFNMLPYKNFVEDNPPERNKQVVDFRGIQALYNTTAVGIESETTMEPFLDYNPGLTEKTMRPLMLGNPFLVYSNRGTLKTLRGMGFKTFGNVIDESYDEIASPQQRWEAILTEVGRLATLAPADILDQLSEVCLYNQEHILTTLVEQLAKDDQTLNTYIKGLLC